MKTERVLMVVWGVVVAVLASARGQMVPFVLPWDDAAPGITDFSGMNRPIGPESRVTVDGAGRFVAGGDRIRFLGMNFAGDSPFMPTNKAEGVASRLAKFGINNVRFHHMDAPWATGGGILSYTAGTSRTLNAQQLDRVHYLVSRLKAHGVYVNVNLLVGREFRGSDGLGSEVTSIGDWKDQHVLGYFNDTALNLQKEYATKLLTPVNRFTGLPLATDPCVAFVEVINENGVLQKWLDGGLDRLPPVYAGQLQQRWNGWLAGRHASDAALMTAWGAIDQALGTNLLKNGAFASGLTSWNTEQHESAKAAFARTSEFTGGKPSARIRVTATGSQGWHIQLNQSNLRVVSGAAYTLSFWAKADTNATIDVAVMRAYGDYAAVGYARALSLTTNWQEFRGTFQASVTDSNVRVNFGGMGTRLGTVWVADVRFQEGGQMGVLPAGTSLATRTVPSIRYAGDGFAGTQGARRNWIEFMCDLESQYYAAMVSHLRTQVGYPGLVFGTILANSPASVQARLDVVDAHAYWQHPQFPGAPWDAVNWTVSNVSMVNTLGDDNTLAGLARQRVKGKPFTVTEYQHPSPNQFGAEGPLLLAAYGALQDWDGLWLFDYGPGNDSVSATAGRIRGFFDTAQHPTKMANVLLAANLFRRGDVRPAAQEYTLALTPESELGVLLAQARAWSVFSSSQLGMPGRMALVSRINTSVGPGATGLATPPAAPGGSVLVSDTGELRWDVATAQRGLVTMDAGRTKVAVGFGAGRTIDWGGIRLEPGSSLLGWLTFGLTMVSGESLAQGGTALLIASGQCENTGMHWKDATRQSVGNQWGSAPTLIEVMPFRLTLPVGTNRVRAWTLDPRGSRVRELAWSGDAAVSMLSVGLDAATLWYEVEVRPSLTAYQAWQEGQFTVAELGDPLISGDGVVLAGDGLPNFVKYALGLRAKVPAPAGSRPYASVQEHADQAYLAMTYRRAKAASGVEYRVDAASEAWRWPAVSEGTALVSTADGGDAEIVTVRDLVPMGSEAHRFLRLSVRGP